ncbi:hypothetical protein PDE_07455 [Penicillium oxalicum 114-2]|uniref:Uncharacterized protein n=1 Tax=Penicillium oxalicum (strain 114-2 / CGMCC 5302) TaxID=933388 RepID=S7ZP72_PENO1|nr:hypothetical protein PDE_07455 [Penicillium oxalicum 114-2]
MADNAEPPRRSPSAPSAAPLQYPTFPPVSASVQEWLSHSRPAVIMPQDQSPPPAAGSLGDSWADLSVSDIHSEDGSRSEHTDTGSLIDQTTPDDVASLDERYNSSEVGGPDDESIQGDKEEEEDDEEDTLEAAEAGLRHSTTSEQSLHHFAEGDNTIDNSSLTTRPACRQSIGSIEFVEPEKWPERERVELKHTIHVLSEAEAAQLKDTLPYSVKDALLLTTVQQTMTKGSLDLDKPYRVLYTGQPDSRNIILDKIGDVLVSSSTGGSPASSANSSRYHVVPTSFGAGAVPNFAELLPIHVQLVVDECREASAEPHEARRDTLHLDFKNRPSCRSWWNGERYQVSSASEWTLPDMAIIFVSDRDSPALVQSQHCVHAFLERHGIPVMFISEQPLWKRASEPIPLNQNSLHMCLESRHPRTGETAVLRRYPIDLATFESITPGQLNRNLASLVDLYPKEICKVAADSPKAAEMYSSTDPEKYPRHWIPPPSTRKTRELGPTLRLVTLALVSVIAISIGYAALNTAILGMSQWMSGPVAFESLSPPDDLLLPSSVVVSKVVTTSSPVWGACQSGCSSSNPVARVGHSTNSINSNQNLPQAADLFEIRIVGDCHVVIKPHPGFFNARKAPLFDMRVQRQGESLAYEISKLFDGVYTLRLDREDAYGLLNITVWTTSKTPFKQVTMVDFGTPWLKAASWRWAAHKISSQLTKDLQIAQTSLAEVCGRVSTDLQVRVGDLVQRAHFLHQNALRDRSLLARETVLSRSKQLSEVVSRNALEQFRAVSSLVHSRSVHVNQEAKGLISGAWNRLGDSVVRIDLRSMIDRVRSAQRATLDRAQARARRFVGRRDYDD